MKTLLGNCADRATMKTPEFNEQPPEGWFRIVEILDQISERARRRRVGCALPARLEGSHAEP
jgi:hypothetical protein